MPLDPKNLFIHQVIREQGALLKSFINPMKQSLLDSDQNRNLAITELIETTFLFDGYEEFFTSLIPEASKEFPYVLSHNDIHQNNILMRLQDNRELLLIDNEYAGWNPMAMDLAVYLNETMIDNSHPGDNGVKVYLSNYMTLQE